MQNAYTTRAERLIEAILVRDYRLKRYTVERGRAGGKRSGDLRGLFWWGCFDQREERVPLYAKP
jgi:hypothetical protein